MVSAWLHGAFIAHKIQQRMANRRHEEPERLQTLDILVKLQQQQQPQFPSSQGNEVSDLMLSVLGGVESVAREFWRSLRWETELLLPASVDRFFSTPHKKRLISLHLAPTATVYVPSSPSTSWSQIEESIVREGVWTTQSKFTSVHLACHESDLDLLKRELGKVSQERGGVLVNRVDANGVTPLMLACVNGQVEIVKYLIAVGMTLI